MATVLTDSQIAAALRHDPGVQAACRVVAEAVADTARMIVLSEAYETGQLASGIHVTMASDGAAIARSSVNHSAPVEGGTGLFGPKKARIVAKAGRPFVFYTRLAPPASARGRRAQVKGLGGVKRKVVTLSHRGMMGRHFLERAGRRVASASPRLRYRIDPWRLAE